jgi:hypothetical protein
MNYIVKIQKAQNEEMRITIRNQIQPLVTESTKQKSRTD